MSTDTESSGRADTETCVDEESTCNGRDDDCDGRVDEGLTRECTKQAGVCAGAEIGCEAGNYPSCGPSKYGSEYVADEGADDCDGLDNDCDGTVDEGCGCNTGETRDCYPGAPETRGEGVCEAGRQTCNRNGEWEACRNATTPAEEQCDEVDNDCDGAVDEGCTCNYKGKQKGICAYLTRNEDGECPEPSNYDYEEPTDNENSCSSDDNDCDGAVDEGCPCDYKGEAQGVCEGLTRTEDGVCPKPDTYESAERTPDGLDNDCDGDVDEVDPVKFVSAASRRACATTSSGTLVCWGRNPFGSPQPPSGSYRVVSVGDDFACALDGAGEVDCWGRSSSTPTGVSGSNYLNVTAGEVACARKKDGTVNCWGSRFRSDGDNPPSVKFQQIDAGDDGACGVTKSSQELRCWGDNRVALNPPSGAFRQVSLGDGLACGVRVGGQAECWGRRWDGSAGNLPQGTFDTVSAGREKACGSHASGAVSCWAADGTRWSAEPTGSFRQISVGIGFGCGVNDSDEFECWGRGRNGETNPP